MSEEKYPKHNRLIYTCRCGWLDLGHMNPESDRPHIGASNLWAQMLAEEPPAKGMLNAHLHRSGRRRGRRNSPYKFHDGRHGFLVTFRMDHANHFRKPGYERRYIVKTGLTRAMKKRVAFAIFMDVSHGFESLQASFLPSLLTNSGYSQEDLVSNALGFLIAVGETSRDEILETCKVVPRETAEAIRDRDGAVGDNKNRTFVPQFSLDTTGPDGIDACGEGAGVFPFAERLAELAGENPGENYIALRKDFKFVSFD